MKPIIAPSILSANFAKLGAEVDAVLAAFPLFTEAERLTEDNWIALRLTS